MTTILSIQSSVAYGHVGNSAAVFPLQRLGVEVWPVHTVHFSNHTGYGAWRGPLMAPDDVREVVTGIEERGAFPEVDAVLSGYQGGEQIGDVILDAVARTKAANPSAIYACDPVMGNAKCGCFVHPAIPVLLRERVVPEADLITPNQFELGFLTETEPADLDSTLTRSSAPARWARHRARHQRAAPRPARGHHRDDGGPRRRRLDRADPPIPMKANGSGDVTAALFTAHLLQTRDPGSPWGAPSAASSTCCTRTHESGRARAAARADPGRDRQPADAVRGAADPLTSAGTFAPEPSGSPHNRRGANVKVPGSGGKVGTRGVGQSTTRSSRWMTSRSYAGPSSRARSRVERPSSRGSSADA